MAAVPKYSPADLFAARAMFQATGDWEQGAAYLSGRIGSPVTVNAARFAVARAEKAGRMTFAGGGTASLTEVAGGLVAEMGPEELDEFLRRRGVDPDDWIVTQQIVNEWGGVDGRDNIQRKAWLKPDAEARDARELTAAMLADIAAHAPRYAKPAPLVRGPGAHMLEIGLFDTHLGMLAWGEETGTDYDMDIARRTVLGAVNLLLARAVPWGVERILLPLGGDILHADRGIGKRPGAGGQTAGGTVMDMAARPWAVWRAATRMLVAIVDLLRVVAPVEIVPVPGNHDPDSLFHLGDLLDAWYRNDERVTVYNPPTPRRYVMHGEVLLGLAHGDAEKGKDLALIMATEAPDEWAASQSGWREWHVGHIHTKREGLTIAVDESRGVRTRVMPSLAGLDAWHAQQGYAHQRACEAMLWHPARGYAATLSVGADEARSQPEDTAP